MSDDLAVLVLFAWGIGSLLAHPDRTARMLAGGSFEDAPEDRNHLNGQWSYEEYRRRMRRDR